MWVPIFSTTPEKEKSVMILALNFAVLEDLKVLKQHYQIEIVNMQKVLQSDSYDEDDKYCAEDIICVHTNEMPYINKQIEYYNRLIKEARRDLTVIEDHQKDIELFSSMLEMAIKLKGELDDEYLELEKELTRIIDPYASSSFETVDLENSPGWLVTTRKEIRDKFKERSDLAWGAGITKNIEVIQHYLARSKNLADKED